MNKSLHFTKSAIYTEVVPRPVLQSRDLNCTRWYRQRSKQFGEVLVMPTSQPGRARGEVHMVDWVNRVTSVFVSLSLLSALHPDNGLIPLHQERVTQICRVMSQMACGHPGYFC